MKDLKIAVCIPTYNRKDLLIKSLEAVSTQSLKPKCIFVFDNHSIDGTRDFLHEKGYDREVNGVPVKYHYSETNGGGAMGFFHGMKSAFDMGIFDAFWMLDDDGIPMPTCLEYLSKYVEEYGYVSPLLMDINNPNLLISACNGSRNPESIKTKYGEKTLLKGYCNPFNGGLFSKNAVKKVGFPKPELFIYGDEQNYHQRMIENGYIPYGVFEARHCHPVFDTKGITLFAHCVNFKNVKWRTYCICRNSIYNKKVRKEFFCIKWTKILYYYFAHSFFFCFVYRSFGYLKLFNRAFKDGLFENWGGQYDYLNK